MTNLTMIGFDIPLCLDSIPLDTLVLSEQLAATAWLIRLQISNVEAYRFTTIQWR
jgi:hypothetical protein